MAKQSQLRIFSEDLTYGTLLEKYAKYINRFVNLPEREEIQDTVDTLKGSYTTCVIDLRRIQDKAEEEINKKRSNQNSLGVEIQKDSDDRWEQGAYISVSFTSVTTSEMHKVWDFASSMGIPFTAHVTHPLEEDKDAHTEGP